MSNTHSSRNLLFCVILLFLAYSLATAQPPDGRQRGQFPPGQRPGGGQFQGGQGRPGGQFVPGQRPGGGQFPPGQRPGGGPPGQPPQPAEENQEPVMVTGPGTVPDIRDENPQEDFEIRPLADRTIISRPISAKVLRYTEHLISKYDTNGNGRLEFDEWYGKLSGKPQVIDLNGDGILTLDEIATHIEKFSRGRTIHNPYPLQQLIDNRVIPEQIRPEGIFRPITQTTSARQISETQSIAERPQLSDDELAEEVRISEETSDENSAANNDNDDDNETAPIQGRIPPSQTRRFAAPTQGLPAWFVQRDLNGDGQVSLYEFCAPNFRNEDLALFGRLDKNGDGFITREELPQAKTE